MKPIVRDGDHHDEDGAAKAATGPVEPVAGFGSGARRGWAAARVDVRAALPAWIVARLLVAVAALVADLAVDRWRRHEPGPAPISDGLLAWDGSFYRRIAEQGYLAVDTEAVRFFPLFPRLGANSVGLVILAWVAALVAGAVVHRLALETTGDATVARRAAWLVGLAPPSFVLVWGYSEGLFIVLAGVTLLAVLRRHWWWAGVAAAAAALCRPTGALLALAVGVEGLRGWGSASARERSARVVAVGAPLAATAGWYAWVGASYGDALVGLDVQEELRGGFVDPVSRLVEGLGELVTDTFGDGLHIPFALGLVGLVVLAARRLPSGLTVFAAAVVAIALGADNLNSLERYGINAVPLFVVAATLPRTRRQAVAGAVVSGVLLVALCTLAWYGSYVP